MCSINTIVIKLVFVAGDIYKQSVFTQSTPFINTKIFWIFSLSHFIFFTLSTTHKFSLYFSSDILQITVSTLLETMQYKLKNVWTLSFQEIFQDHILYKNTMWNFQWNVPLKFQTNTVKSAYKDHPWDQQIYTGSITWKYTQRSADL